MCVLFHWLSFVVVVNFLLLLIFFLGKGNRFFLANVMLRCCCCWFRVVSLSFFRSLSQSAILLSLNTSVFFLFSLFILCRSDSFARCLHSDVHSTFTRSHSLTTLIYSLLTMHACICVSHVNFLSHHTHTHTSSLHTSPSNWNDASAFLLLSF